MWVSCRRCTDLYGLALVNGSHYTLSHIRYLGLAEILLGLLALIFIGQSLYIWMLGFGLFQMVYGLLIQRQGEGVKEFLKDLDRRSRTGSGWASCLR